MIQHISITEDEFYQNYNPIQNPLDKNASFNGCLFETYGQDLEYVRQVVGNIVWTIIESEDRLCALNGYHVVNRLGYFICQHPYHDDLIIEVEL